VCSGDAAAFFNAQPSTPRHGGRPAGSANQAKQIPGTLLPLRDQGGVPTLEMIRRKFGERVAEIVKGCTDTFEDPKPPWEPRKRAYFA
jgi:hypothetical protein